MRGLIDGEHAHCFSNRGKDGCDSSLSRSKQWSGLGPASLVSSRIAYLLWGELLFG